MQKTVRSIYLFPKNEKSRLKWIQVIASRRKNYRWKSSDRVFVVTISMSDTRMRKSIPFIFAQRDPKTSEIVGPTYTVRPTILVLCKIHALRVLN